MLLSPEPEGVKLVLVPVKAKNEVINVEKAVEALRIEASRCKLKLRWRVGSQRLFKW